MASPHILIVDDGSTHTLTIRERLMKLGYEVISLSDSSEKSIVNLTKEHPDLVLLDFMHEVETLNPSASERVERVLNIPVVYIVDKKESLPERSKVSIASPGMLLKPVDDLELKSVIETALARDKLQKAREKLENRMDFLARRKHLPSNKSVTGRDIEVSQDKGKAEALEVLRQVSIFSNLPEQFLNTLAEQSQFACISAGEFVTFEGDEDDISFIVVTGRFAMTKSCANGKTLVVDLLGPGEFFGLVFALEQLPAELSARAQEEGEILCFQSTLLQNILEANPALYKDFAQDLSHRLRLAHSLSLGLAHENVKVRIASLILNLIAKFSRIRRELSSPIVIDITRQQIADLTGTTPETATRVTRAMHKDGVINCANPGVLRIINVEALTKLAEERNF